jgi:S-adenosylmethionine synthetase
VRVPVDEVAKRAAAEWLRENLRFVDPNLGCRFDLAIGPGSESLGQVYRRQLAIANDTSIGVGYAPLSPTENLVLDAERFLNSPEFKRAYPEAGEDVKVMAIRRNDLVHLTIAMALVDRFLDSESSYFRRKVEIVDALRQRLRTTVPDVRIDGIDLNALDAPGRGESGLYLTVCGTSAENGDDGQVGRGNTVNGLIALNRPRGPEAAPGKNPVSHVGKVYSVLAGELARNVYREVPGLSEVYVRLVSQIGAPIDQPLVAAVQALPEPGASVDDVREQAFDVVDRGLANVADLSERLLRGEIGVY